MCSTYQDISVFFSQGGKAAQGWLRIQKGSIKEVQLILKIEKLLLDIL